MSGTFGDSFADARPLAQHCAQLIRKSGPRPEDRLAEISGWCRDLGQELAQELGQLFTGGKLRVQVAEPEMISGQDVFDRIGAIAANSLLRCDNSGEKVLLSLDLGTAIALTDCSFGGDGQMPDDVPAQLPGSAAMLVEQLAAMVAQVIAVTNGSAENARGDVLVRSESVTRLKPFDGDTPVAYFPVTMEMSTGQCWSMALAVSQAGVANFLPGGAPAKPRKRSAGSNINLQSGAFAEMPMPLEAVLSEFDMSLNRLDRLAPGDEIPLCVPTDLPLRIGDDILAHGKLGTIDNRMALRITRIAGQTHKLRPDSFEEVAA